MKRLPWLMLLLLAGCSPKIPAKVAPEEYEVYSAWMRRHFEKAPPANLYLSTRTFSWPAASCGTKMKQEGVDSALVGQLVDLGEAEYPLDPRASNLRIPWPFKEAEGYPTDPPRTYRLVAFSRVAFNRRGTLALFAVSDSCGGLCGDGGAVVAWRDNGAWLFKSTGCVWIY